MGWKLRLAPSKRRLAILGGVFAVFFGWLAWLNAMPGTSYDGEALTASDALEEKLAADVTTLAVGIGERNIDRPVALAKAEAQ